MADIHSLKQSITELSEQERLDLILNIRSERREAISRSKKKKKRKSSRSKKSTKPSKQEAVKMAENLSESDKAELRKLLNNR